LGLGLLEPTPIFKKSKINSSESSMHPNIYSPYGVPQGVILSPTLYNIFTSDIPNAGESELATFADDTAIFVSGKLPEVVCGKLPLFLITSRIGRFESILQKLKRSFLLDVLAQECSRHRT
jgi:hypothetical protein